MRDIYKIIDKLVLGKYMVRFNSFPGGTLNLSVHTYNPDLGYLYGAETLDELEAKLKVDFGHLIAPSSLPLPPGLPKPW